MGESNCKNGNTGPRAYCVECDITQMARNNYFTGKLLVERDFTDEQRYVLGKLRRHNQRLHGWGAVCGLKVVQHPNPACQDRFVVIQPGTAIDCCGREILVTHDEYFDFKTQFLANWQKQNGPNSQPDNQPHMIQICVSYEECPTEDVPALFDDCNCSAASCQPNRILESYSFDVLIDPPANATDGPGVKVDWDCTVGIENAVRVAKNDATKRLYVLTSDATAKSAALYAVDSSNKSIIGLQTFANYTGLDVAVSSDGDFVYLALLPAAGAPQVLVLKTSDLGTTINALQPGGTATDIVRLAVAPAPDDRLFALFPSAGVFVWAIDIQSDPTPAAATTVTVGSKPVDIAIDEEAQFAYVANSGDATVSAIAVSDLSVTPINVGLAGTAPAAIAVANTTNGDTVAVLDTPPNKTLCLIAIPSAGPASATPIGKVTTFSYPPLDLQVSLGGRWIYVLEKDSVSPNDGYIQVVDEHAVELGQPNVLDTASPVGIQPEELVLSDDGSQLYVPYLGDGNSVPGAVAVLNVTQTNCPDIFNDALEPCPDCATGNCIALATVNSYVYGQPITEAEIDNRTDRQLLLSTDLLTNVVRCLLDQGTGGGQVGPQGLPGPPGKDGTNGQDGPQGLQGPAGPGITDVSVQFVPCDQPGSATLTGTAPNFTLDLTIPGPCNPNLTVVKSINWPHAGILKMSTLEETGGLQIAFSAGVKCTDLSLDTVTLLIPVPNGSFQTWAEAGPNAITVKGVNFPTVGDVTSTPVTPAPANGLANGVALFINRKILSTLSGQKLRVCVRSDFIRDSSDLALDGDHLPPWVPTTLPAGRQSGDGIEGGTFESWFTLEG
jgi:DNA-binding beta-propeller fold protein YncE